MEHNAKNLLLLGVANVDWSEALAEAGWTVNRQSSLRSLPPEFWQGYQVVVFVPQATERGRMFSLLENLEESEIASFLPVLPADSDREEVLRLVHLGVADVLLGSASHRELLEAVAHVESHQRLYSNNRSYSRKLERANKELRESLDILKMDHLAGRQVQKSLLPRSPIQHRGYTVTHTIIPSLYLSGDFVAYNLTFDRFILFFIADVSGHGASSAFVTILLRFILKRIIRRHVRDNDLKALVRAPEGFMEHVNRQLLATGLEKQVTMFGGAIDTDKHIMRYAVAAQMPMPVFVSGHDARYLPGKGKILGLFEDAHWDIDEIVLPEQFQLVMVSDGLLETLPGRGLEEQEQKLLEIIASAPTDHQGICHALGVDKLGEVADDVSILTISKGVGL